MKRNNRIYRIYRIHRTATRYTSCAVQTRPVSGYGKSSDHLHWQLHDIIPEEFVNRARII